MIFRCFHLFNLDFYSVNLFEINLLWLKAVWGCVFLELE